LKISRFHGFFTKDDICCRWCGRITPLQRKAKIKLFFFKIPIEKCEQCFNFVGALYGEKGSLKSSDVAFYRHRNKTWFVHDERDGTNRVIEGINNNIGQKWHQKKGSGGNGEH